MEKYQPGEHDKTAGVLQAAHMRERLFQQPGTSRHRRYYGGHTGSTQGQERQRPGEYHCGRTQAGFGGSGELQRQSGGTPVYGVV